MSSGLFEGPMRGRPVGAYGPVAKALCDSARSSPGAVRDLCARAQVAYAQGRYTASRLVEAGELVVLQPGRPAVLGAPAGGVAAGAGGDAGLQMALAVLQSLGRPLSKAG